MTFSVPIEKKVKRIDKDREEIAKKKKKTSYRLQFIKSLKFMTSALSNLVNNLAERIHKN